MNYKIYKLSFTTPVHFGTGVLNESAIGLCADTLFSALYIEALKLGIEEEFYTAVKNKQLLISDAFPYADNDYFLPKPMIYVEPKEIGDSKIKKQYKKLKYIPADKMGDYLKGNADPASCSPHIFGKEYSQVMAFVRRGETEETLPYRVGNYLFNEKCGLYIIAALKDDDAQYMLEELFESLSYTGVGGKRSSGKGRFEFKNGKASESINEMLTANTGRYMLISSALPKTDEMEAAIKNATYLVHKRSGFVYSEKYSDDQMKKRDLYTFQAGSCFTQQFEGDIYDVSENGNHAVYRYAMGMFLGV